MMTGWPSLGKGRRKVDAQATIRMISSHVGELPQIWEEQIEAAKLACQKPKFSSS